jgi:hypothetical protein
MHAIIFTYIKLIKKESSCQSLKMKARLLGAVYINLFTTLLHQRLHALLDHRF